MVSALAGLLLILLSDWYAQAAGCNPSQLQDLDLLLTRSYDFAFRFGMIALGAGSVGLCYVLYRAKIVLYRARGSGHYPIPLLVFERLVPHFR